MRGGRRRASSFTRSRPRSRSAAALGVGLAAGLVNGLLRDAAAHSVADRHARDGVGGDRARRSRITGGVAFVGRWDPAFLALGRGSVLGVPALILWTAAVALVALFVLKQTRLGLHLVFTGEAEEAARLAA